jgi:hypothetical protein
MKNNNVAIEQMGGEIERGVVREDLLMSNLEEPTDDISSLMT